MHIFFAGIGGTGIGPLALIAKQAGYTVSGSDKQESSYIDYLKKHGIDQITIGQDEATIAAVHAKNPIDWYVYSSALPKENPNHPELNFAQTNGIKHSKRDEFLNHLLEEKNLKLIAIAGTHGKSTTTAMTIWLMKELGIPISYSVGAKLSFGDMGTYDPNSQYFIYECDEFDRNFLAFQPFIAAITGIAWDHHEIYPTEDSYQQAFSEFLAKSEWIVLWDNDAKLLHRQPAKNELVLSSNDEYIQQISLGGLVNRQNAWEVAATIHELTQEPYDKLIEIMNRFPGLSRRMEQIKPSLYSDYAHTPEKIVGAMGTAKELAAAHNQKLVVVYEPLTNRRMHYTKEQHAEIFNGVDTLYWVPSYLAREDPEQPILSPNELIQYLNPEIRDIARPMELNEELKQAINQHLTNGDMVVALSGGGGRSLDEWLRTNFTQDS